MKISVCIPTYNSDCWLAQSINSIVKQTFKDWEIIVIDDGSTDSTNLIIDYFSEELGKRLKYAKQKHLGIGCARNNAISMADGEIICVQDADDLSQKERLEKTWKYFKRHKEVDMVYGSYQIIDAIDKPYDQINAEAFDFEKLKKHNYICHPTVAYRKKAIRKVGYRNDCKVLDDWFMYVDFVNGGFKIDKMDDVLAFHRYLPNSTQESNPEVDVMRTKFSEEFCGKVS